MHTSISITSFCVFAGVAELLVFHPVDTIAKRLMSNKSKVCHSLSAGTRAPRPRLCPPTSCSPTPHPPRTGVRLVALPDHLQGVRDRAPRPQAPLPLPRARLRRGLQGHPAHIQVRRPALVLRHPQPPLPRQLHQRVRRAQGQDDDAGRRGQVRLVPCLLRPFRPSASAHGAPRAV